MQIRFKTFLSGVTLSAILFAPILTRAESPEVSYQDMIISCQEQSAKTYNASLEAGLKAFRLKMTNEWKTQTDFRIRAASASRKNVVTKALARAGVQLDTGFNAFGTVQTRGLSADVAAVAKILGAEDSETQDAALDTWINKSVSVQSLDTVLVRLENSLRLYANTRDRATLSRVWRATRTQATTDYRKARTGAREAFVNGMLDCLTGESEDSVSDDMIDLSLDDTASDDTKTPVTTGTQSTGTTSSNTSTSTFQVVSLVVNSATDYPATCRQHVTSRVYLYANGVGRITGYFLYQDGQRSQTVVVDTDASGYAYAQDQRVYSPGATGSAASWSKFVVTSPNSLTSRQNDFTIQCQNQTTGTLTTNNTSPNSSSESPRFLEVQLSRSGAGTMMVCGEYTVQYLGYVRMSQANTSFTYHFERNDGVRTADQTATTNAQGAANVYYNWALSRPMYGWVKIVITQPYTLPQATSHVTDFTSAETTTCTTSKNPASTDAGKAEAEKNAAQNSPSTGTNTTTGTSGTSSADKNSTNTTASQISATAGVSSSVNASTCGMYRFVFKGSITSNIATSVKYRWERSDGAVSPINVMNFTTPGTQSVSDTWDIGGDVKGWEKIHVLGPEDLMSGQADFSLAQACK